MRAASSIISATEQCTLAQLRLGFLIGADDQTADHRWLTGVGLLTALVIHDRFLIYAINLTLS
jgi:hypothetical protein